MKKFYEEYFYISKHGKIREKVMLIRVATTIVIMIACLAAMSFSAYAYFSHSVTSNFNVIEAADFRTEVTVTVTSRSGQTPEILTDDNKTHIAFLKAGEYDITVRLNEDNTAKTGFCVISAEGGDRVFHTQQLGNDGNGRTEELKFTLKIDSPTEAKVKIFSHWGTSVHYADFADKIDTEDYVINGETVTLVVNGGAVSESGEEQENSSNESKNNIEDTEETDDVEESNPQNDAQTEIGSGSENQLEESQ